MKVSLIAMPWSVHTRPSAAIGALAAHLRDRLPAVVVESRSEYVRVAAAMGFETYDVLSDNAYTVGELLYLALLYPEQRPAIRETFLTAKTGQVPRRVPLRLATDPEARRALFDLVLGILDAHLDETVAALVASGTEVVGMTTCFGQLFANLALAARLKAACPEVVVVFGGSTVSARVGPSILQEFPQVDFVIQGEGELPLAALIAALAGGDRTPVLRGVVSRQALAPAALWEVPRMDDLSPPDYDEYAALAEENGLEWALPVEGSRGCWWDRSRKTGNPKATCFFCNLNVQWSGYREKTIARVVAEVAALTERYTNTRVYFLDNILRYRGAEELGRGLASLGKDLEIFYEMRAQVRPRELLAMWEAGLTGTQFGIEALSNSVLRRIGKGTSVIQNLEVMKTCAELGVRNDSNLMLDFPGSTAEEVAETVQNIQDYALLYQPCHITRFHLGVGSTVDQLRDSFAVRDVRNADLARGAMPEEVWQRLSMFDLDYVRAGTCADWTPVERAVEAWNARRAEVDGPMLEMSDGGTFLTLTDRRQGYERYTLDGLSAALYRSFLEIQTVDLVAERLGADREEVEAVLSDLAALKLVYREGGRCLSLAMAANPRQAARRIRAAAQTERVARVSAPEVHVSA